MYCYMDVMSKKEFSLLTNAEKPPIHVKHSQLERVSEHSIFKSRCPKCKQGVLLIYRDEQMRLMTHDRCLLCAQAFIYDDIEELRKRDGITA